MLIFVAIAIGSFILVAGSFLFGHDTDTGDGNGDADHGAEGHDFDHDAEPTIGFFSMKVIGTLTMGFGAAGAIARYYGSDYLLASLWGAGTGIVLSLVMYLILSLIYRQQASSLISTSSTIGLQATVTVAIGAHSPGEVELFVEGREVVYLARSAHGKAISKGHVVKVVSSAGGELFVEEVQP